MCAYEGKRLVGFAKVVGDGGVHGFLLDPTVAPDRQRTGIGRKLVEACAREARRRGIEWLHVDYEPQLAKFYRACGFSSTQAGLRNLKNEAARQWRNPVHRRNSSPMSDRIMEFKRKRFFISTDSELLDVDFLCRGLNATYWATNRSRAVIEETIRNSVCFGVYHRLSKKQVGFARVVTDKATFAWVCDVFIDESYRKKGLGKCLMSCVTTHPWVKNTMSLLGTRDAHGLYEKYGYVRSEQMKRLPKKQ